MEAADSGQLRGRTPRLERDASALLVIDVQERLAPHVLDAEGLVARIGALLTAAQAFAIPCHATEHCPDLIGPLVAGLRARLAEEHCFRKTSFGALDHPEFHARLRATGRSQIVVTGMEAHVCVMQSALGLVHAGFDVFVVGDAVASRRERQQDRAYALDRLRSAGCTLLGTETALFEWTRSAEDPAVKSMIALVKSLPR